MIHDDQLTEFSRVGFMNIRIASALFKSTHLGSITAGYYLVHNLSSSVLSCVLYCQRSP